MASYWRASVTLIDDNKKRTSLLIRMGQITDIDFAGEATEAYNRLAAYVADLKAITTANVYKISLTTDDPGEDVDSGVPSTGSDVSEELVLVCHTDDPDELFETDNIRVPSPEASVWVNDNYEEGFDLSDALAAALVANYETDIEFSDSEHVDVAQGTNGIEAGFWRSRRMSIK